MQKENNLEDYTELLLSAALQKCGNIYDAEDLTQETLLAALSYLSCGNIMQNTKAWLFTVLNRKFYDMLRKKYRQPSISIGDHFDIIDETAFDFHLDLEDEASSVRKSVAYLAKIYREVIVRYYMNGQNITQIAAELGIPEGTVKSRLSLGRARVKERMYRMEKYSRQSYDPVTLYVANSGTLGRGGEPMSLVNHDLIAQNILWLAYAKPLSVEEISSAIGIPAAYIEPIVQKLSAGELMQKIGAKYYTDFIISTAEDTEKYISAQKELVHHHFHLFWNAIEETLLQIRETDIYKRSSFDAKNSLELYIVFRCLDHGLYRTFQNIFHEDQFFPDRPNGGCWIAFGHVHPKHPAQTDRTDSAAYSYSGERLETIKNYAGNKSVELHIYGADGFLAPRYNCPPEGLFFTESEDIDAVLMKLLCLIDTNTKPESVGFNIEYLKIIPWLIQCKVLCEKDGKPAVNIPVLSTEEAKELWTLCTAAESELADSLKELLSDFYHGKKQKLPQHLSNVPLQKQYLYASHAILFSTVREAIKHGFLYDGNYDNISEKKQPPCPMILVLKRSVL